jgi:hypothetical protein
MVALIIPENRKNTLNEMIMVSVVCTTGAVVARLRKIQTRKRKFEQSKENTRLSRGVHVNINQ